MELKLHATRFDGLKFVNVFAGLWRFVDCHDKQPNSFGECRCVGPQYKTKSELLSDMESYAIRAWGY